MPVIDRYDRIRFNQKVRVTPGCWIWQGSLHGDGYGHIKLDGKVEKAHRFSYFMHVGQIPEGMIVRHRCDNPQCVNPEHLVLGTHEDNAADRDSRKRAAVGERSGKTSLTDNDVREMIRLRKSGVSRIDVAAMFGVSTRTVWYAIKTRNLE